MHAIRMNVYMHKATDVSEFFFQADSLLLRYGRPCTFVLSKFFLPFHFHYQLHVDLVLLYKIK